MNAGTYPNRSEIVKFNRQVAEALDGIQAQVNSMAQQTTASAEGSTNAPPRISKVSVTSSSGVFDAAIQDDAPVFRGINYFLEYSTTASFSQPHVVDLGASRTWRGFLGAQTFYFRAYSQYPTSEASEPVYFGTATEPTPVQGGGVIAGPTPQPSSGSGTAPTNGKTGGAGFGKVQFRGKGGLPPRTGPSR